MNKRRLAIFTFLVALAMVAASVALCWPRGPTEEDCDRAFAVANEAEAVLLFGNPDATEVSQEGLRTIIWRGHGGELSVTFDAKGVCAACWDPKTRSSVLRVILHFLGCERAPSRPWGIYRC